MPLCLKAQDEKRKVIVTTKINTIHGNIWMSTWKNIMLDLKANDVVDLVKI